MTLLFHKDGRQMFTCKVCDKHLDLEDNEGGYYNACKEHTEEVEAANRAEYRRESERRMMDRARWFGNYKEVNDSTPACPYCFKEYRDWWGDFKDEDRYTTDLVCPYCEKEFKAVLHIDYAFITTRKEEDDK